MPPKSILMLAALVSSVTYQIFVFTAGILAQNLLASRLAIVTAGVCYLSYSAQLMWPEARRLAIFFVVCSVVIGVAAGLALLFSGVS